MTKSFQIGKHTLGTGHPPYIIAEMSGNHNQDLDRAFSIIDAAQGAGVQAVKLQTYTADTITLDYDGHYWQDFTHPVYDQGMEFIANLSIIDCLFNMGPASRELVVNAGIIEAGEYTR